MTIPESKLRGSLTGKLHRQFARRILSNVARVYVFLTMARFTK